MLQVIYPDLYKHALPESFLQFIDQAMHRTDWSEIVPPEGMEITKRIERMRRSGHRMLFVSWLGKPLVLKFFADFGDPRTGRRLEFILKNFFTNFAVKSFRGALSLDAAGVRAIQPFACITASALGLRRGVFVYHEVLAEQTLGQWFAGNPEHPERDQIFFRLAEIINDVRRSGLIQPDLVKSNVLVSWQNDSMTMTLIDTDGVRQLPRWFPGFLGTCIFVWSLRRMRVPAHLRAEFFSRCMGGQQRVGLYRFFQFIQDNNFKPWKRLLRKKK